MIAQNWLCGTVFVIPAVQAIITFSIVKLVILIGWVYLCLYFVQLVQSSTLIPKNYKSIANIVTLFIGPVLLGILLVIDTVKKRSYGNQSFPERIKEQLWNIISKIKSSNFMASNAAPVIILMDSSGRSIKEVCGQGKNKKQDRHILDLTEDIILDALEQRASDILVDPKDSSEYTIRFRVDGVLRNVKQIDTSTCKAVVNSIKALSGMDIAERRRPQDGSFIAKTDDGTSSFRVASAGVINGEKLSVRILNRNAGTLTLNNAGFPENQKAIIREAVLKPSGMVLVCGPTGSGKTTTLYGMLNEIDLFTRNVVTVEDPIECVLPNASQIEVNAKADITFAKALRSILRQDPDVICVGEIRDEETASIALRAAQTGHLVLATVHSNSNGAALVRLLDLGVKPVMMASGLNLVFSQRLVRLLCEECKVQAQLNESQIESFSKRNINCENIYQARGCAHCNGTGYYGRTAICDILALDNKLKSSIANNDLLVSEFRSKGDEQGRVNLYKEGMRRVLVGQTSLEEVKRVVG